MIGCWTQTIIFYALSFLLLSLAKNINISDLLTDEKYTYWHYRFGAVLSILTCLWPIIEKRIKKGSVSPQALSHNLIIYSSVCFLAALLFCSIYGIQILNPVNTDWLMVSGDDLTQHYLGWRAFRAAPWHFPIGMFETLSYPQQTSVIFTDSIPVCAVFFKIISPLLPEQFQYFGIWGLLSFLLQAFFTAKIVSHFTNNKLTVIASSILFLYAPVLIFRMFGHSALSAQWLLLWEIKLILDLKNQRKYKSLYTQLLLIGILSAGIHMFFVLMNGILLVGLCIKDTMIHKKQNHTVVFIVIYLLAVSITTAILGGFSSNIHPSAEGLGTFSANLNTLFNPQGWSVWFHDLNLYKEGQIEGFGWLGAGIVFLFFYTIVICLNGNTGLHNKGKLLMAPAVPAIIAFLFSLSPVITCGKNVLYVIKLPNIIEELWAVFRSSGRLVWIPVYLIMLFGIYTLCKNVQNDTAVLVLLSLLVLQICDMHERLDEIYTRFHRTPQYESLQIDRELRDGTASQEIKHLVYVSEFDIRDNPIRYALTDWALNNNITMNDFYFARPIKNTGNANPDNSIIPPADDTVYIFKESDAGQCSEHGLSCHFADGLIIGYTKGS